MRRAAETPGLPLPIWQSLAVQAGFAVMFPLPWYRLAPSSPMTFEKLSPVLYAALAVSILAPSPWMTGVRLSAPRRASRFMNFLPVFVTLTPCCCSASRCSAAIVLEGAWRWLACGCGRRQSRRRIGRDPDACNEKVAGMVGLARTRAHTQECLARTMCRTIAVLINGTSSAALVSLRQGIYASVEERAPRKPATLPCPPSTSTRPSDNSVAA